MKTILKSILLLCCTAGLLTACDDDRGSNPVVQEPATFMLNTPAYATSTIDMASSETLHFTWSQPDYGFPAKVDYQLQVSLDGNFTTSYAQEQADKSGATKANYKELTTVYNVCSADVNATELAKAFQQIAKWADGAVPATQTVYVRAKAVLKTVSQIYSNTVKINVSPYYVELKDAAPQIWYLIGGCIADGKWANGSDAIGVSMIPMYTIAGESYDKVTGGGLIQYVGYFPAGGEFKIIEKPGNWDYGICGDKDGHLVYRNGGDDPGNIKVKDAGYYKITVNTTEHTAMMEPYTAAVTTYPTITLPGTYQGWKPEKNALTKVTTGGENHDWTTTVNFDADANISNDEGVKFTNGSWDVNWGAEDFPLGTGTGGGKNIRYKKGTYKVYFNDILGSYQFVAQ